MTKMLFKKITDMREVTRLFPEGHYITSDSPA